MSQTHAPQLLRLVLPVLAALVLGPGNAHAGKMDGWPEFLKKEMAKEVRKLKFRSVSAADDTYRFQMAGKPKKPEEFDGGWYFQSDIRTEALLECYIFTGDESLAAIANSVADINIEANAEANDGAAGNRSVFEIDAGAIDGAPYLSLEWVFTIGEAPNALAGFVKVRAAIKNEMTLVCNHNYLGYRQTFADAFAEFVRTAELPASTMPPYYEEVAVQSLNGQQIGITRVSYARDDEGDSRIKMISAALLPLGPNTVGTSDSRGITWSTPEGNVINAFSSDAENGDLVTDMRLDRNENGDWVSSGIFQGKEIEQVLDGATTPVSEIGQMQAARALFSGENSDVAFPLWIADADPTQFLDGRIVRNEDSEGLRGRMELGPLVFDAGFDADGALVDADIQMGSAQMTVERVWVNGEPE